MVMIHAMLSSGARGIIYKVSCITAEPPAEVQVAHYHNAINRDESGPLDQAGHNLSANAGKICFLARFNIFIFNLHKYDQ